VKEFIDRYVAVWNEPDAELRRQAVATLWTPDGAHSIDSLSPRVHDALIVRVTWRSGCRARTPTARCRRARTAGPSRRGAPASGSAGGTAV
jgi:hypothetical protein